MLSLGQRPLQPLARCLPQPAMLATPGDFEFQTERMHLVRLSDAHLDDLLALDSDPEVMRFITGKPSTRDDYVKAGGFLERMTCYDDQPHGFLAAYVRESSGGAERFVGWFHLRPSVFDPDVLELGYRLRREVWGRGLATEGTRALIDYAFGPLDQFLVDACADPRNAASTRVMEKCGMQREGLAVHPRVPIEVVRYVLWRD